MAKIGSSLFLTVSVLFIIRNATAATTGPDTSYVTSSCKSTTYPSLCVRTLSRYATVIQRSPRRISLVALSVSLSRAESAYSFLTKLNRFKNLKPREYRAVADCLELMDDSADRLTKSVEEMKGLPGRVRRGPEFLFHMSNVQTWASAALTDGNTCVDGFAEQGLNGKVKDSVRAQVLSVVQVTANALGLVNQFAERY